MFSRNDYFSGGCDVRLLFILKLAAVIAPLIIAIGYIEHGLSGMSTHYYKKRVLLEKKLSQIEILSVGSSNTYYGINPQFFERTGFNLALLAQSMYYDKALVLKYLDKMPRLKLVILPAIFYTMGTELSKTSENWRMYFYRQYFNIPLESKADQIVDWGFLLEPKNFSKIALFGERSYDYILNDFRDGLSWECTERGWFNSGYGYGDLSKNIGPETAKAHNLGDPDLYEKNLGYWEELVIRLKTRNIVAVILLLPSHPSYHDNLDPSLFARMKQGLQRFADKYQVQVFDYTTDPRFSWEDYAVSLPDHLNARGAEKFSRIINKEIIVPAIGPPKGHSKIAYLFPVR